MHTISKCHIYDKRKNFFYQRGMLLKNVLKIEMAWHYLFLIDKAKILDLLSLRFIEQNKIFYLMVLLVLQKYILLRKYINKEI